MDGKPGNGIANAIANTVFGAPIVVRDHEIANVIENETLSRELGSIRVIGNISALVQNIAAKNIVCENTNTDAFVNYALLTLKGDCGVEP